MSFEKVHNPLKYSQDGWHSRGYLPHFNRGEVLQSVTFRLFDSLPKRAIHLLEHELINLPDSDIRRERFKRIESLLDAGYGKCYLLDQRIAKTVEDTLLYFDGSRYNLHSWCIMPNHVHTMLHLQKQQSLADTIHSIKSFSANRCNSILGRNGSFWYEDYYDRYIRNAAHYNSVINYIETNPVKAALCSRPEEWRYGSAWWRDRGTDTGSAGILARLMK